VVKNHQLCRIHRGHHYPRSVQNGVTFKFLYKHATPKFEEWEGRGSASGRLGPCLKHALEGILHVLLLFETRHSSYKEDVHLPEGKTRTLRITRKYKAMVVVSERSPVNARLKKSYKVYPVISRRPQKSTRNLSYDITLMLEYYTKELQFIPGDEME
jgi:hypothetical protein